MQVLTAFVTALLALTSCASGDGEAGGGSPTSAAPTNAQATTTPKGRIELFCAALQKVAYNVNYRHSGPPVTRSGLGTSLDRMVAAAEDTADPAVVDLANETRRKLEAGELEFGPASRYCADHGYRISVITE